MRIVVCGSRYDNRIRLDLDLYILDSLKEIHEDKPIELIIHGNARGADKGAQSAANFLEIPDLAFLPDWKRYKQSAGFKRNEDMLNQNPDLVVAYWNGHSNGTKDTIDRADGKGLEVEIYYIDC